jgi:serine/threonine protein kinase
MEAAPSTNAICFGPFRLDLKAGELYKDGRRIRLQEQPFRVLQMLVEHPGEVVSREEIRRKLWPNDTIVEFDHSINTAIKKLRLALADSAERPRYVETVARRGYRLLVPVEWKDAQAAGPQAGVETPREAKARAGNLIGKKVSHYRILAILGAGGMGVVYSAEDLKLGRRVALKFLPEELGNDATALERFEREARAASSLDHPNICTIYGVEEHDGQPFIVMQLLEGETLREQMQRVRPPAPVLPTNELLDLAIQIADGLEAAHQKGIIHRDIKPANIFVTKQGQAKILDFGLAKLTGHESGTRTPSRVHPASAERPPHQQAARTAVGPLQSRPGMAMGTAAYMSPEQAAGQPVDARSDIFSFAVVLYELLSGQGSFTGKSDLLPPQRNLNGPQQSGSEVRSDVPYELLLAVGKALEKDPADRYQSMREMLVDLKRVRRLKTSEGKASVAPRPAVWRSFRILVWGRLSPGWLFVASVTALVIGVLIGPAVMRYFKPVDFQVTRPVVRSVTRLDSGQWLEGFRNNCERPTRTAMALSSDGTFIVYSVDKDNTRSEDKPCLYLRRFEQLEAKPIAGTEGGISPFLSPDDRWVGLWADGKLMKVSVEGGVATVLCDVTEPFGFSWGADNQIVFTPGEDGGLAQVSADGGKPETLTTPDKSKEEWSHRLPYCLSGEKASCLPSCDMVGTYSLVLRLWNWRRENGASCLKMLRMLAMSPLGIWLSSGRGR